MPKKYIWNAKYTIKHRMSVHKQPIVFNTTYMIQSRVNCPYVFKSCIGFMLSNCMNEKMCICFHMFFKSSVDFGLSNCLNANKTHLECEIHNTA